MAKTKLSKVLPLSMSGIIREYSKIDDRDIQASVQRRLVSNIVLRVRPDPEASIRRTKVKV
ncbi:hypothetical protein [Anaerosporomusa subterranea]|uniref:hypothetical protein n=1 Tax=Anaerosporomusa subterranea TaxID=1794912 RepID=UPI0012E75C33|nr:hypothetical protein [Anaerosporomusa subterranea]